MCYTAIKEAYNNERFKYRAKNAKCETCIDVYYAQFGAGYSFYILYSYEHTIS